jgi:SWI/SNF-related matrix-associated actin-dependent regulator 1 of chromatin subfamily A
MFPSRYPGVCVVCSVHFPAADLLCFKLDGRWQVVCHAHREQAARASVQLAYHDHVDGLTGPQVIVTANNLDRAQFDAFLPLVRTGTYLPRSQSTAFPATGTVVEVIKAMRAAGLPLAVDAGTRRLLEVEQAAEQAALAAIGDARLFPYQRIGAAWLRSRTRALLADDMGLGKTAQALSAIEGAPPLVIVSPAVAKGVWAREISKWRPNTWQVSTLAGRGSFRWPGAGEAIVTNYECLSTDPGMAHPYTVVIFDEAHLLKEPTTARYTRAAQVAQEAARLYLLTATPLLNRPPELWHLLKLADLHTEAYGSFRAFCAAFGGSPAAGWGTPTQAAAMGFSRVALRRMKAEVLDQLPPKRRSLIPVGVAISRGDQVILDEAEAAVLTYGRSVPFELISKARAITAKSKIPALLDRVEEYEDAGEPLVVFSCHLEPVEALGVRPGWALITGSTSPDRRTAIEEAFQRGELRGVAATVQAGGVAITLTRAAHVLFCDRAWTPALNEQAEDRCNRIGQTRGVLVEILVAARTLDERVEEIIEEKSKIIAESVNRATVVRIDTSVLDGVPEEIPQAPIVREAAPLAAAVTFAWEIDCPF